MSKKEKDQVALVHKLLPGRLGLWARNWMLAACGMPCDRHGIKGVLLRELDERRNLTVIDVGASEGEFTSGLVRTVGVDRALLIEPQSLRCSQLNSRFADDRFKVVCAAVGAREDRLQMDILNFDYSSSMLPVRRDRPEFANGLDFGVREAIDVRVAPLDVLCVENDFHGPYDLLKVDVQGPNISCSLARRIRSGKWQSFGSRYPTNRSILDRRQLAR